MGNKLDMKKIKLGFIGAGFIAQECHLPSFSLNEDCTLFGIADLHYDLAMRIAKRYEITNVYKTHKDLLENEDIDAVVVTLPRQLTYGVVRDCLLAGKHVFTEKPLALNINNAEELKDLSSKNKLLLQIGYMKRFDLGVVRLKEELLELYKIDKKPILVNSSCFMGDSYCNPISAIKPQKNEKLISSKLESMPSWLNKKSVIGYENYLNTFSHVIDLLNFLLESPLELITSKINDSGFGITLFSSSETPVELSTMKCNTGAWIENIDFIYDDRIISIQLPPALLRNVPSKVKIIYGKDDLILKNIKPKWSWSFINQANSFIELCKIESFSINSVVNATENVNIVHQIFQKRME